MCVPCIRSGGDVYTWYKKQPNHVWEAEEEDLGQAPKKLTARQQWNHDTFDFLVSHLVIHTQHSQLGKLTTPTLLVDPEEEEGGEDDDATSVTSTQQPVSSQAAPTYPRDRRPPRPAASAYGCKLDEAMLKLVDKI